MVREHIDALRTGMRRRGVLDALAPTIERAIALDKARRDTIQAVEERKAARNAVSQQVGQRKRAGESADDLQQRSRALGDEIARLDGALQLAQGEIAQGKLAAVPHLIKLLEKLDAYHGDELYAPPIRTPEQHLGVMVRLKLERLAASRMVVWTPQIAAPDANAASGKENLG